MTKIRFGTDGWRAIIAQDFTVENVARVAEATAVWVKQNFEKPTVVIGHDCRFAGELFAETASKVFIANGVKVFLAKDFVSTPMISLGTVTLKASLGIVITASHNPPSYNGYKLKGYYGGPLGPEKVQEIEDIIPEMANSNFNSINLKESEKNGLLEYTDLETMYINHVEKSFDIQAIRNSNLKLAYDSMFGAGKNVMKRLFPEIIHLHSDDNPGFHGQAPEPIHKNLLEISNLIKNDGKINCGLCTDGDADRIGLYDSKGNFVDSHHLILLLIKYLIEEKNFKGKIVVAFSVTPRIHKLAKHYNLPITITKVGFKYIADHMITEDVLIGGEESGGIAIKGHIPERDGIWVGLTIWEYMAKSGKTLEELIVDLYKLTGAFVYERNDLHLSEEIKQKVIANCNNDSYKSFGSYKVERLETIDGWKYHFENEQWIMIRASGTEPVLRLYGESDTLENTRKLLKAAEETLLG